MRRAAALALLSTAVFAAGIPEVAETAARGDKVALRKLVEQHADVNAP